MREGESPLIKGIYERNNRNGWEPGSILVDNVVISKSDAATSILPEENACPLPAAYYDLSGRRLKGKPTAPGVYIMNGKKVVIR